MPQPPKLTVRIPASVRDGDLDGLVRELRTLTPAGQKKPSQDDVVGALVHAYRNRPKDVAKLLKPYYPLWDREG
jgi:hypothetical protein